MIESAFVVAGGVRYHYKQMGAGPALLLIHGLIGSADNWDENLDSLARSRSVYALDLANMGKSERVPAQAAGLEAAAGRLADCMDGLGIEAADIAGHSHGGAIAMMFAAMHPVRVRSLTLFAPANPFCALGHGLIAFYNTRLGTWFARQIPKAPRALHHLAHKRMYGDPARATPQALDGYTSGLNPDSIEHVLRIVRSWHVDMAVLKERLPIVAKIPTLLIWGEADPAVSIASGYKLSELLRARLVVFPGVGHIAFAERPAECNAAMADWLG